MVQPHAPAEIYQLHNLEEQEVTPHLAASVHAQQQQHRYVARVAPDRIRLEPLSPPLCDAVVKLESNSFAFS